MPVLNEGSAPVTKPLVQHVPEAPAVYGVYGVSGIFLSPQVRIRPYKYGLYIFVQQSGTDAAVCVYDADRIRKLRIRTEP